MDLEILIQKIINDLELLISIYQRCDRVVNLIDDIHSDKGKLVQSRQPINDLREVFLTATWEDPVYSIFYDREEVISKISKILMNKKNINNKKNLYKKIDFAYSYLAKNDIREKKNFKYINNLVENLYLYDINHNKDLNVIYDIFSNQFGINFTKFEDLVTYSHDTVLQLMDLAISVRDNLNVLLGTLRKSK